MLSELFLNRVFLRTRGAPKALGACALGLVLSSGFAAPSASAAFDPSTLPEMGVGAGGVTYFNAPVFANLLFIESRDWRLRIDGAYTGDRPPVSQLDANGYPLFLNPDETFYAQPGQNMRSNRNDLLEGRIVVTWEGRGDVQFTNGSYVGGDPATGLRTDGRRVYDFSGSGLGMRIEILELDPTDPVTKIRVWAPDPADPQNQSLEPAPGDPEPIFNPVYIDRLDDPEIATIRFMDWNATNASPQMTWSDRRPPNHVFMAGRINSRPPANGFSGDRRTGVAWEYMVALSNETNTNMWISLPHMATDTYVRNLANLILFGSDINGTPYTSPQVDPYYAPLDPSLKLYIEYSNEIWSNGSNFAQGNWAQDQANTMGINRRVFNARRASEIWSIFQEVFGGTDRLVRVASAWTGANTTGENYTRGFLTEAFAYGPMLPTATSGNTIVGDGGYTQATQPDVLAVTTYFGQSMQFWVRDEGIEDDPSEANLNLAFDEWERRLLSLTPVTSGVDQTGAGGGFGQKNRNIALDFNVPIVAYEGGPNNPTDALDLGSPDDDGITDFMAALNRHPRIAEMYRIHLTLAKQLGLRTHDAFVDVSLWGKFGFWGHLEYLDQPIDPLVPGYAVKWRFLLDWVQEQASINHIDDPVGTVPEFLTETELPPATVGTPYFVEIEITGDGSIELEQIGGFLPEGLSLSLTSGTAPLITISGTPTAASSETILLRALDPDGDPAYRIFNCFALSAPSDQIFASDDFELGALGLLHEQVTGVGFAEEWNVQNGSNSPGFAIEDDTPLTYPGLTTSGGQYVVGGDSFRSATHLLDVSGFGPLIASADDTAIGQTGTTLWMRFLIRMNAVTDRRVVVLADGSTTQNSSQRLATIDIQNGNWALSARDSASDANSRTVAESTKPALVDTVQLIAVAVEFGTDSDTLRLYVDPPLDMTAPLTADATLTTNGAVDMLFRSLGWFGGSGSNQAAADDFVFADSFGALVMDPSPPPPPPPPSEDPIAFEDFESGTVGVLDAQTTGTGFSGEWVVQANSPGFVIADITPFSYPDLITSGGQYVVGGDQFRSASRLLDVSAFGPLVSTADSTAIGEPGTTLWVSFLARFAPGAPNTRILVLASGNQTQLTDQRLATVSVTDGFWSLTARDSAAESNSQTVVTSSKARLTNTVQLVVAAIDFGATSDTLRLYVDPPVTFQPPATPDAELTTNGAVDLLLRGYGWYGSTGANQAEADDFRFGETFSSVVPSIFGGPAGYDQWALDNGLSGSDADPDADPDMDGVNNAGEYAGGSDPDDFNSVPEETIEVVGNFLYATFIRRNDDANVSRAAFVTEVLDDASAWRGPSDANGTVLVTEPAQSQAGVAPGYERVQYRSVQAVGDVPRLFIFVLTELVDDE
ncbi:MAG: hypothetical protein ACFBZ8_12405 [Opitutales bacterium]